MAKPDLQEFRRKSLILLSKLQAYERAESTANRTTTNTDRVVVSGGETDMISRIIWFSETRTEYERAREELEEPRRQLEAEIDKLESPLQYEAMRCHYLELMTVKQIATALNYHPDTVRKALRDARQEYYRNSNNSKTCYNRETERSTTAN